MENQIKLTELKVNGMNVRLPLAADIALESPASVMIHFNVRQMHVLVQRDFAASLANYMILCFVSVLNVTFEISLQNFDFAMGTLGVFVVRLKVFVEQLLCFKAFDTRSALANELFHVVCLHDVTIQIGE